MGGSSSAAERYDTTTVGVELATQSTGEASGMLDRMLIKGMS